MSEVDAEPETGHALVSEQREEFESQEQPGRRLTQNFERCESIPQYAHGGDIDDLE